MKKYVKGVRVFSHKIWKNMQKGLADSHKKSMKGVGGFSHKIWKNMKEVGGFSHTKI